MRKFLVSYVLLCAVTLSTCNDVADTEEHLPPKRTALFDPDTTASERHSRSFQKPKSVTTAPLNQDTKTSETKSNNDDLHSSSSAARRTAKSPLVLRLLQEQEPKDTGNQLAQLRHEPEEETVYYQQSPQENARGVPEYAEPEYRTPSHKETGVRNCLYILWLGLARAEFPSSFCVVFIVNVRHHEKIKRHSQNVRSLSYNIILKALVYIQTYFT
jgi:hypothetical protein